MISLPISNSTTPSVEFAVVILNPVSCPSGPDAVEETIARELARFGVRHRTVRTCKAATALSIAAQAVEDGADLVVAVGGDGTIMEAMNALIGTPVPLGVVPMGTGNLLALNLNIPVDISAALNTALTGRRTWIDLVRVNRGERHFAIMGGLGFDARIMADADRATKRRFGRLAYFLTALRHIRGHRFPVRVRLDDGPEIHVVAKSVLAGNVGQISPGIRLFDEAAPDDGLIEIGILKANTYADFIRLGCRSLLGRPADDPAFDAYRARRVEISTTRPQPFECDGEWVGETSHVVLAVCPRAVQVVLPKTTMSPWTGAPTGQTRAL